MGRLTATVFFLLAGSIAPASAVEQTGLLADGLRIARESCVQCHAIEGGAKPSIDAHSFEAIAAMPSTTSVSIKVFLKTPHANMPDIILSEAEIDALAAYILSLRKR